MGLLEKAEKRKEKKVTTNDYSTKDDEKINKKLIESYVRNQIKKEETNVKKPKHAISAKTAKLQIKRPKGTSDKLVPEMASIKESIKTKLNAAQNKESFKEPRLHADKNRVCSGTVGLDEVMEGGFKKNTVNLVGGGAGSGKSIFCMQFLVEGIKNHGENGVYISFEESEDHILKDFKRFNWDLPKFIKEKKLIIMYISPEQVEKVLNIGGGTVIDAIKSINAQRLVLDSLTSFTLLYEKELERRKSVLRLVDTIQKWKVTALVTSEQEPDPDKHHSTIVEFEVDGTILLYNIRKGDIRERSLEIFKMRGTQHSAKIFPMKINESGVVVFPEDTVF